MKLKRGTLTGLQKRHVKAGRGCCVPHCELPASTDFCPEHWQIIPWHIRQALRDADKGPDNERTARAFLRCKEVALAELCAIKWWC